MVVSQYTNAFLPMIRILNQRSINFVDWPASNFSNVKAKSRTFIQMKNAKD